MKYLFISISFVLTLVVGTYSVGAQISSVDSNASFPVITNNSFNPTSLSPSIGDKIVDQSSLSQYNQDNYIQFDSFDFHGEYQGNNAQELTPIPDPPDTVTLPSNFPVLGNVFTI